MTSAAQPVWFFDIDGVINALRPRDGLRATRARTAGELWPIHWSPDVVEVVNTCHRSGLAEVRWLTTWEQDAHLSLAPAVGLDHFVSFDIPHGTATHGWWKADVVDDVISTERRPFVWADDELAAEDVTDVVDRLGVDHLLVSPDPERGLTSSDLATIVDFLTAAPTTPCRRAWELRSEGLSKSAETRTPRRRSRCPVRNS